MYIYRNIPFEIIWRFGWKNILLFLLYGASLCALHAYAFDAFQFQLHIPFALIGPIGVAVAIYASFKNGQSYDRMWEARKNWGGLSTATKIFANQLMMYLSGSTVSDIDDCLQRQIAYLNAHKFQLRKRAPHSRPITASIRKYYYGEPSEADWQREVYDKLNEAEAAFIRTCSNKALQLYYLQQQHLRTLQAQRNIDEFRLMDMMKSLDTCLENQGKNERIKSTPFPRQYAFFSRSFVIIYILILPFGILDIYKHYSLLVYAIITLLFVVVAWLFITIELVGSHSEDPFDSFITDIPMNSICRTVEIDLAEMRRRSDIPEKVKDDQGFLM
ncbi:MAG: hypothetical protein JNJ58_08020 [Chitinophagaceae bacterium]|nr:hypothetical protein [Chitinophagaceae bacterium]